MSTDASAPSTALDAPLPQRKRLRVGWWLPPLLLWSGFVTVLAVSLVAYGGTADWRLDLLTNFRLQYTGAAVLGLLAAALLLRWRLATAFALVGLLNLGELLQLPNTVEARADERVFKVIAFNMLTRNESLDTVTEWIAREAPDIFVAIEHNTEVAPALRPLIEVHGYQQFFRPGHSVAIYSRLPFTVRAWSPGLGLLAIEVAPPDGPTHFMLTGVHLFSPRLPEYWNQRNAQLRELAQSCAQSDRPLLVMGDLNCSPQSPFYVDFVQQSGLTPVHASWLPPVTWARYSPLLFASIDHAFRSPEVGTVDLRTGPSLGSDHRPIIHEFVLRP
ncbi:MAG: endonuclease/exonuclease/phosphatase family protein [Opitutales bacterium]